MRFSTGNNKEEQNEKNFAYASSRPVTRVGKGPLKFLSPSLENVLDIV